MIEKTLYVVLHVKIHPVGLALIMKLCAVTHIVCLLILSNSSECLNLDIQIA